MIDDTLLDAEERMDKALSVAREDLGSVRTGRAAPSMFNKILVDYYGSPTPLQQLASFNVTDALVNDLAVMDATALSLCRDNDVTMRVFGMGEPGNVTRALLGDNIGTLVTTN